MIVTGENQQAGLIIRYALRYFAGHGCQRRIGVCSTFKVGINPMQDHLGRLTLRLCLECFSNLFGVCLDELAADGGDLVIKAKGPIQLYDGAATEK